MTPDHAAHFADLVRWRRDVRRFKTDAIPHELIQKILSISDHAPSVGNSQPWRVVLVETPAVRAGMRANFEAANRVAALSYVADERSHYLSLKLAGFDAAPVHAAVFCDVTTQQGRGLGIRTMPEMLAYSCVSMITTLWYAARAEGLGLGWVSILEAGKINAALNVPEAWKFVGYLLIGVPMEEHTDPELERAGWQARTAQAARFIVR
jgi:5,6-dimethylbenzimidazole synthase